MQIQNKQKYLIKSNMNQIKPWLNSHLLTQPLNQTKYPVKPCSPKTTYGAPYEEPD